MIIVAAIFAALAAALAAYEILDARAERARYRRLLRVRRLYRPGVYERDLK